MGKERAFRIKQFFYDWSIPGIYADTNLVGQGEPFVLDDIAGFLGVDYKGNVAASYAKWFTQVELSVLRGHFEPHELFAFFEGLVPAVEQSVAEIGQKAFALTSHTARFHVPRWTETDPINRVNWQSATALENGDLSDRFPFPISFQTYKADSVGSYDHHDGREYQLLFT